MRQVSGCRRPRTGGSSRFGGDGHSGGSKRVGRLVWVEQNIVLRASSGRYVGAGTTANRRNVSVVGMVMARQQTFDHV